jgi:hypothetical protein
VTPAQTVVSALRGKWYRTYGMICCPAHEESHPSCRIRDGEQGVLVSCYAGCDRRDVIRGLKAAGVWPERERPEQPRQHRAPRRYAPPTPALSAPRSLGPEDQGRVDVALAIWKETTGAFATVVDHYWHEARGLTLPIPDVIRFGAAVPYGVKPNAPRYPAMVAMVQAPDGAFAGVHCTYLLPDGSDKRRDVPVSRLAFGCIGGCAIRLAPAVDELAIGEGIESAASYMAEFGVAGWAALNTSGLRSILLPPPPLAFAVTLLGENDDGKGKRNIVPSDEAIAAATARLRLEGRLVGCVYPAEAFKDFNDAHRHDRRRTLWRDHRGRAPLVY